MIKVKDCIDEDCIREFASVDLYTLTEKQREVVVLHYFNGMSFSAIAEETGRSKPHVIRSHSTAIRRLKKQYE
jgi:RNA polymerase sigma factor (sigma-70 family)